MHYTDAHSAVKLSDLGEDGSTYINANYIQVRQFISCVHGLVSILFLYPIH